MLFSERTRRWNRLRAGVLPIVFASACVTTTFEGPGEPPRVTVHPYEPKAPPGRTSASHQQPSAQPDGAQATETIEASHLLVQYRGAQGAAPSITRSREEARARALEARDKARAGQDFQALVAEYSDEPGAAETGGYLGTFPRSAMVEEFGNAAFALKPGEVSDVVESPFGFHVILRHH
jgi:hypothetical protein